MQLTTIKIAPRKYAARSTRARSFEPRYEYKPERINLREFNLVGYLAGVNVNTSPKLNPYDFDCIQVITLSTCTIKKGEYIHAIGTRKRENKQTILVFKKL